MCFKTSKNVNFSQSRDENYIISLYFQVHKVLIYDYTKIGLHANFIHKNKSYQKPYRNVGEPHKIYENYLKKHCIIYILMDIVNKIKNKNWKIIITGIIILVYMITICIIHMT